MYKVKNTKVEHLEGLENNLQENKRVLKELQEKNELRTVVFVKTSKRDLQDCVICMDTLTKPMQLTCDHVFCAQCIDEAFKFNPVCPICGAKQSVITGNQPPGTMDVYRSRMSLAGYPKFGRIEIEYRIQSGLQEADHPQPGKRFEGVEHLAYLPDNEKGRQISKMLEVAFKRKLVFTIGTSLQTQREGVVIWNDISHKTSLEQESHNGYPDETYLDRVTADLALQGVTEKDI